MAGQFYYLITSLPSLDELGTPTPMTGADFVDLVEESVIAQDLVKVVLLSGDLLEMQALKAGEIEDVSPSVLTAAQARGEEPLPDFLAVSDTGVSENAVWEAYFQYASSVADLYGCEFLRDWISYEVGIRNGLIAARARKIQVDPEEHYVAREISDGSDFNTLINEWSSAENPMAGQMVLDKARWNWLAENDSWFKFTYDELVVYAARLLLLKRWDALSGKASA